MPNSRETGYTASTTENVKCGEDYLDFTIPKPYSKGGYGLYFPQPSANDLKLYLEGRNKNEDEIKTMVNDYCYLRENPGGINPFIKWCMKYDVDIAWIIEDFNYISIHLQSTMPDNTVNERTRIFEKFIVQRGPFGREGIPAGAWLIQNRLYAGPEPKNFIPNKEEMEECEEIIKNSLMNKSLDEIVKKRDEFREAAAGFTATNTAEDWLEKNGMPNKACMCECGLLVPVDEEERKVSYRYGNTEKSGKGLRRRNKRYLGNSGENITLPKTDLNPSEETTQGPTTADKLVAGTLGVTAVTGTVAAVLGTGSGSVTAGALGTATTGALGGNATSMAVGAAVESTASSLTGAVCTGLLCVGFGAGVLGTLFNCYAGWSGRGSGSTTDGLSEGTDGELSNVVVTQPDGGRGSVRGALGSNGGDRRSSERNNGKSSSGTRNLEQIR